MVHPCQSCGACCAHFRVLFYWREAEASDLGARAVPIDLTEDISAQKRGMKGTSGKQIRCVALQGKLAEKVSCSIYGQRPTPCRDFEASYENGEKNSRCDKARGAYGLAPLKRSDWPNGEAKKTPAPTLSLRREKESAGMKDPDLSP